MDSVGCVSGITSGELFYRAAVRNDRSWLNQKVGPSLLKFLNDGIDRQSILGKFEAREDELNEAEEVCLQCRKNRTKALREKLHFFDLKWLDLFDLIFKEFGIQIKAKTNVFLKASATGRPINLWAHLKHVF